MNSSHQQSLLMANEASNERTWCRIREELKSLGLKDTLTQRCSSGVVYVGCSDFKARPKLETKNSQTISASAASDYSFSPSVQQTLRSLSAIRQPSCLVTSLSTPDDVNASSCTVGSVGWTKGQASIFLSESTSRLLNEVLIFNIWCHVLLSEACTAAGFTSCLFCAVLFWFSAVTSSVRFSLNVTNVALRSKKDFPYRKNNNSCITL